MATTILATKLFVPPSRPKIVHRSRLIERLNKGLHNKLTLISAPAGYGKTTLVSEWIASCGRPVAWLSLDEGDNDPARFLIYLVAALQTISKDIGKRVLGAIQTSQPLTIINEVLLATLLNDIVAIPNNFILVLDDYHLIDSEPIDQALTFLLDHLPTQVHLVITTREDPSLPLPRYRVRGNLTELRAADLRFTPEEAGAFLTQMMNHNLSVENIAALETRTEGWIAGLQMAALSMQNRTDPDRFIQAFTGSHRFVLDYLAEEILLHQSGPIRSFLLQTAILDQFCAPLCDAITEREDSKAMLEVLERNNLFLIPLDDTRQWYRYHRLFAEVLQTYLVEAQPDQVAALHLRASVWYERTGLGSDAIRHALAANDLERVAGLLEMAWPAAEEGIISQAAWYGWVKVLPVELVHARPVLTVWFAYALLGRGEIEAAEARLNDADRWVEASDPRKGQFRKPPIGMVIADQEQWESLPATIAIGRAYIAQSRGNIPETVRYARRVIELTPEVDSYRHSQAAMMLGMTYWARGDLKAADQVFSDYTLKLRAAGNIPDAISTTVVLAEIRLALGHLQEAIRTIEQLLSYIVDQGEPISPHAADLHRELGELYLEQGQLEAASQRFQSSKELGEKAELPVWRYRWFIAQARLSAAQGDLDGALSFLGEAERLYIRTPLPDSRPISAMKARIWLLQGRLAQALEWVREQGLSPDDDPSYLREYHYFTLARILIAQYESDRIEGKIEAARRLLDRLLKAAEDENRIGSAIEILALFGLAHQVHGDIPCAHASLERALALAEPESYILIFVDEGKPMAGLLASVEAKIEAPRAKDYCRKLLSIYQLSNSVERGLPNGEDRFSLLTKPAARSQPMIEPLSQRELEVLQLLRTELSGPEIARECCVSLSTIRTHTQNIYTKLGVNNRRAAVRRAEEFGLL